MTREGSNIKASSRELRRKALSYYEIMLKKLKNDINLRTVKPGGVVERYLGDYERELSDVRKVFSRNDLVKEISLKNCAFFGNFRTDNETRRDFLGYLESLAQSGVPLSVAVDIPYSSKKHICSYLNMSLKRTKLLNVLGKEMSLDFINGYLPIMDLCRSKKIPLLPIGFSRMNGKNIVSKDGIAAKRMVSFYKANRDRKMMILAPDSWLALSHLPLAFERELGKNGFKADFLRVFSGSDRIYLKLAGDFKENNPLVQVSRDTYVSNLVHPVARYNAFFNWLEGEEEISDFSGVQEAFSTILQKISDGFDFKIDMAGVRYRFFSNFEIGFLEHLLGLKCLGERQKKEILDYISRGESYFMPYSQTIYLNNLSKVHASEEAGHYLRYLLAGVEKPKTDEDKFYSSVINEALAFMSSKLLVPKRAPIGKRAVKKMLKGLSRAERDSLAIHSLGYELGQRLFKKFREGRLAKRKIKGIFSTRFKLKGEARLFYEKLSRI